MLGGERIIAICRTSSPSRTSRGAGVGAALIAAVREAAAERGVTNVYWMTHETNATARRLYDRVARRTGFIEYDLSVGFGVKAMSICRHNSCTLPFP